VVQVVEHLLSEREASGSIVSHTHTHTHTHPLMPGISAHVCNPSYSGGRDQEGLSLKRAWANSSRDPILKKTQHKKGMVE
jgi:hypothetical protein